jgi:hypothetical protein
MTVDALVSPEEVVSYALEGRFPKPVLASLLTARARRVFGDACGAIELQFTDACRAQGDPCLESGCSAEGERCLQPLLNAGTDYNVRCGTVWATLFQDPANRDPCWRVTVSTSDLD